jgi:hypothetical protein
VDLDSAVPIELSHPGLAKSCRKTRVLRLSNRLLAQGPLQGLDLRQVDG